MSNKSKQGGEDVAHKSWWQIFEVIFGFPFLVAIILQYLIPYSLNKSLFSSVFFFWCGVTLSITGIVLIIFARRQFKMYHQPTDPGLPTSKLVTTGVFSISRNPLYLGGVLFLTGIALMFNLGWVFTFLVPSILACHYILIVPEEKYLAEKFGEKYHVYAAKVYRWLGRKMKTG